MAFIREYRDADYEATAHIVSHLALTSSLYMPCTTRAACHLAELIHHHTTSVLLEKQEKKPRRTDLERLLPQCRATLPPSLNTSPSAIRLAPYLWTHQFTLLSPSTCFILDDGTGRAVGYCIGCPHVPSFAAAASYDRYTTEILDPSPDIDRPADLTVKQLWNRPDGSVNGEFLAQMAYNPRWLLVDDAERLMDEGYLATLHIDLLEEWQGKGWGRKLIGKLLKSVSGEPGSKGLWIGVAADNAKVVPFYEKMGFKVQKNERMSICLTRDF